MAEPADATLPPPSPAHPVQRFVREDEVQELFAAMRLPEYTGKLSEAAELVGIDPRRAKDIVRREIARVILRPDINGNITATAAELGLPMKTVWNQIQQDGFLKTVNPATDPAQHLPEVEDTINRPVLTDSELAEMRGLIAQDKALTALDWDKLGMGPEQRKHLLSLEQFAKGSLRSSLDLTHGGMLYCFAELIDLFKTTKKAIDDDDLPVEQTEFGAKDARKEYLYLMASMSAEIRSINNQVQRSQILRIKAAEIELLKRGGAGPTGKPKRDRPGFDSGAPPSLVQVNVGPGGNVNLGKDKS